MSGHFKKELYMFFLLSNSSFLSLRPAAASTSRGVFLLALVVAGRFHVGPGGGRGPALGGRVTTSPCRQRRRWLHTLVPVDVSAAVAAAPWCRVVRQAGALASASDGGGPRDGTHRRHVQGRRRRALRHLRCRHPRRQPTGAPPRAGPRRAHRLRGRHPDRRGHAIRDR
jgi:hypothetical protein